MPIAATRRTSAIATARGVAASTAAPTTPDARMRCRGVSAGATSSSVVVSSSRARNTNLTGVPVNLHSRSHLLLARLTFFALAGCTAQTESQSGPTLGKSHARLEDDA